MDESARKEIHQAGLMTLNALEIDQEEKRDKRRKQNIQQEALRKKRDRERLEEERLKEEERAKIAQQIIDSKKPKQKAPPKKKSKDEPASTIKSDGSRISIKAGGVATGDDNDGQEQMRKRDAKAIDKGLIPPQQ